MRAPVKRLFYVRRLYDPYLQILERRSEIVIDKLENDSPDDKIAAVISVAHAFQISSGSAELNRKFHVQRSLIERMPNLLLISTGGAGFDTVNVKDCTQAGVLVVNQTGGNADAVASHVVAVMLSLSKKILQTDRALRRGTMNDRAAFVGNDVHGRTIGIIGLGNVGRRVADLCRGLFRMNVIACDPCLGEEVIGARGALKVTLPDLLRAADFVSVNCPLDETTRGMIGEREFALMKPQAFFITTARGFIHDERALAEALRAKKIAGAGIDVWSEEPPPPDQPLLQFDNVIASPHTAGVTHEAQCNLGRLAAEQVVMALDGKRPPRIVNPDAWPTYAARFKAVFGIAPE